MGSAMGRTGHHRHYDDGRRGHPLPGRDRHALAHDHRDLLLRLGREQMGRNRPSPSHRMDADGRPRGRARFLRRQYRHHGHPLGQLVAPLGLLAAVLRRPVPHPHLHCRDPTPPVGRTRASSLSPSPSSPSHDRGRGPALSAQALFQKQAHVDRLCHPLPSRQPQCPAPLFPLRGPDQSENQRVLPRCQSAGQPQFPHAGLLLPHQLHPLAQPVVLPPNLHAATTHPRPVGHQYLTGHPRSLEHPSDRPPDDGCPDRNGGSGPVGGAAPPSRGVASSPVQEGFG